MPQTEDFLKIIRGMRGNNGRASALSLIAYIDCLLEGCLMLSFVQLSTKETNRIFRNSGAPLYDVSPKIKMAYALGIISDELRRQLEIMRDIRNAFAHSMHDIGFTHSTIKKECKGLDLRKLDNRAKNKAKSPEMEYRDVAIHAILHLREYVIHKVGDHRKPNVVWLKSFEYKHALRHPRLGRNKSDSNTEAESKSQG